MRSQLALAIVLAAAVTLASVAPATAGRGPVGPRHLLNHALVLLTQTKSIRIADNRQTLYAPSDSHGGLTVHSALDETVTTQNYRPWNGKGTISGNRQGHDGHWVRKGNRFAHRSQGGRWRCSTVPQSHLAYNRPYTSLYVRPIRSTESKLAVVNLGPFTWRGGPVWHLYGSGRIRITKGQMASVTANYYIQRSSGRLLYTKSRWQWQILKRHLRFRQVESTRFSHYGKMVLVKLPSACVM